MKKNICIMLCLVFIFSLCACSRGKGEDTGGLYFSLTQLPGAYEQKKKDTAQYLGKKAEDRFAPSESIQSVVPYIAKTEKPFFSQGSKEPVYGCSLGLATKEGKIITGGIYKSIEYKKTAEGGLIYFCSPYSREKNGSDRTDIIPSDGSFLISTDKTYAFCEDTSHRHSCFCANGIIYDSQGNELIDCTELGAKNRIFRIYYFDGDKAIFSIVTDKYNEYEYSKENAENIFYFCMDTQGNLLYELNTEDGYFIDGQFGGAFVVSKPLESGGRSMKLCDVFGNSLSEKSYGDILYDSKNQLFVCLSEKSDVDIVKPSGETLNTYTVAVDGEGRVSRILTGDSSSLVVADFVKMNTDGGDEKKNDFLWFDLITGDKIEPDTADMTNILFLENDSALIVNADGSGDIYDAGGAYAFSVGDIAELLTSDKRVFVYTDSKNRVFVKDYGKKTLVTVETDKNKIISAEILGDYVCFYYENGEYELYGLFTGEKLDGETGRISPVDTPFGTYYGFCSETVCGLLAPDGSELIKIYDDSYI